MLALVFIIYTKKAGVKVTAAFCLILTYLYDKVSNIKANLASLVASLTYFTYLFFVER